MENLRLNQNNGITFPEEASSIIRSLVGKYGLETLEELIKEVGSSTKVLTLKEKSELKERLISLPGRQIAKTVKEVAQEKIRSEDAFLAALQERLNIPGKTAKELAKDLEEKVLSLVQITFGERKKIPTAKEVKKTKPALPRKPDTYREPIE